MSFVLDSSALLALLLDEEGAEMVAPITRTSELSMVNFCEVMTKAVEGGGDPDLALGTIESYGIRVRSFREAHAIEAARLRPLTMHLDLSLGDRVCIAQGKMSAMPVLTADRRMAEPDVGVEIRLIR